MYDAAVLAARSLTPHLRRITLGCEGLRGFRDDGPDQRVKLLLPRAGQDRPVLPAGDASWYRSWLAMPAGVRPVMRTYTVRAARPADGELDVDVVVHGDTGPGSRWALRAAPGDRVGVFGAWAEYDPPPGTVQLLAGDHTALPALAAICERLSPEARARVVVEVAGAAERLPMTTPSGVVVDWVDAVPGRPGDALAARVREVTSGPPGGTGGGRLSDGLPGCRPGRGPAGDPPFGYAWVAADARTTADLRRHLVRRVGLTPEQVMFMGYWRTDGPLDPD